MREIYALTVVNEVGPGEDRMSTFTTTSAPSVRDNSRLTFQEENETDGGEIRYSVNLDTLAFYFYKKIR